MSEKRMNRGWLVTAYDPRAIGAMTRILVVVASSREEAIAVAVERFAPPWLILSPTEIKVTGKPRIEQVLVPIR